LETWYKIKTIKEFGMKKFLMIGLIAVAALVSGTGPLFAQATITQRARLTLSMFTSNSASFDCLSAYQPLVRVEQSDGGKGEVVRTTTIFLTRKTGGEDRIIVINYFTQIRTEGRLILGNKTFTGNAASIFGQDQTKFDARFQGVYIDDFQWLKLLHPDRQGTLSADFFNVYFQVDNVVRQ
jgi:hypothetical protein